MDDLGGLGLHPKSRPDKLGDDVHATRSATHGGSSWAVCVPGRGFGCCGVLLGYGGVAGG